jgi:hypothetical protein
VVAGDGVDDEGVVAGDGVGGGGVIAGDGVAGGETGEAVVGAARLPPHATAAAASVATTPTQTTVRPPCTVFTRLPGSPAGGTATADTVAVAFWFYPTCRNTSRASVGATA